LVYEAPGPNRSSVRASTAVETSRPKGNDRFQKQVRGASGHKMENIFSIALTLTHTFSECKR
jgi:hypothetical protein